MSKLKNIAYDMAEETIDETIEKIVSYELKKEVLNGGVSEH